MAHAQTIRELAKVRADPANRKLLNAIVGNQGTALGRKNYDAIGDPDGEPCIIIYVPHKINQILLANNLVIPPRLATADGSLEALTDVVVTTAPDTEKAPPTLSAANQQLVRALQWQDATLDHIPPGAQIGFAEVVQGVIEGYVGTIGYIARPKADPETVGFITNQHVGVHAGHSLYIPGYSQPTLRAGITRSVMEYRPDDDWLTGVNEPFAYVRTDTAFVEAEPALRQLFRNNVPGNVGPIGPAYPIDLMSMDIIGKQVKKVGRTTGLQFGTVVAFGYGYQTEEDFIDRQVNREPANFYTDLLIAPRAPSQVFSWKGDSGSAILLDTDDDDNNRGLGLLWGGWPGDIGRGKGLEDLTYGIRLAAILDTLDLELVP